MTLNPHRTLKNQMAVSAADILALSRSMRSQQPMGGGGSGDLVGAGGVAEAAALQTHSLVGGGLKGGNGGHHGRGARRQREQRLIGQRATVRGCSGALWDGAWHSHWPCGGDGQKGRR